MNNFNLVDLAKSFLDVDVDDATINLFENENLVIFSIDNNRYLSDKTKINEHNISVRFFLDENSIQIIGVQKIGVVDQKNPKCITWHIHEQDDVKNIKVLYDYDSTYLYCNSYTVKYSNGTSDIFGGNQYDNYYYESDLEKTIVEVAKEYTLYDGYPTNKAVKYIKTLYHKK